MWVKDTVIESQQSLITEAFGDNPMTGGYSQTYLDYEGYERNTSLND